MAERANVLAALGLNPYSQSPGEEYMSEPMRTHFDKVLTAWSSQVQTELETTGNTYDLLPLTRRIRKSLLMLDHPVTDYGYCPSCGEQIGVRRLEQDPVAELCADCQMLVDMRTP
ncbi:TraR/DksA C4-type zinc finger protein [Streptomyces virginiae]|uniref:TraR/DksA C4-type zinc finger protein n=1 Tax=Streptomyces virginiae TaxID=1961 RepID=UPI0037BC1259